MGKAQVSLAFRKEGPRDSGAKPQLLIPTINYQLQLLSTRRFPTLHFSSPLRRSRSMPISYQQSTINSPMIYPKNFFEGFTGHPAILLNWQSWMGPDLPHANAFLHPIQKKAKYYPCMDESPCGCTHEVFQSAPDRIVAYCTCEELGACEKVFLQESDLIQYQLDIPRIAEIISQALELEPLPIERSGVIQQFWRIGRYRHALVYLSPDPVTAIMAAFITTEPCLLIVPTEGEVSPQIRELLRCHGSGVLALEHLLQLGTPGQITARPTAQATLEAALPKAPAAFTKVLVGIDTKIDTIRTEYQELRATKVRLQEMQSKGLFEFTQKVDPKSFKILCTILAEGDVAKASRALKVPYTTVQSIVYEWSTSGPAYKVMQDLVQLAKKSVWKRKGPLQPRGLPREAIHRRLPRPPLRRARHPRLRNSR